MAPPPLIPRFYMRLAEPPRYADPMPDPPNQTWRRFFRFRLSTWLVLAGIAAWAMATRPYVVVAPIKWTRFVFEGAGPVDLPTMGERLNPYLGWPALALLAFLARKGFWLIRATRRERPAARI